MATKNTSKRKPESVINKNNERGRHFTSVSVRNFRCFKDFSIGSLERINLIGGMNNVGKTALLETLFLLLGGTHISVVLKINAFRGMETSEGDAVSIRESLWGHLFHDYDSAATINITGELGTGKHIGVALKQTSGAPTTIPFNEPSQGKASAGISGVFTNTLQLQYKDASNRSHLVELLVDSKGINLPQPLQEPLFPGIFLSARRRPSAVENAARYGQLELAENHYDLLAALHFVEPRLKRLSTIVSGGVPMLHGDIGLGRMLPLTVMGDGLGTLTSLLLAISSAPGGVVLIDEIENGFHYSILEKVWKAIAETARRYNTQVFATTHSFECIEAAHDAFKTTETYDFRYHRLQKIHDTIEAVTLDQSTLQNTIEAGWEIR